MRASALVATAALAAATSIGAAPAHSATAMRVELSGQGTYVVDGHGAVALSGTVSGRPFGGTFTAGLAAEDGSLPEAGVCEAGAAAVRVVGSRGKALEVLAAGTVCGEWPTPTYLATHVFTGRYDVTTSSVRRVAGTDGWISLRLANDGRADVELSDT